MAPQAATTRPSVVAARPAARMLLAALTLPGPTLVTERSACALIKVITGALVLLPGVGSGIGLPTVAVLVTAPPAGARTVTLKFVLAPLVNAGIVGQ